MGGGGDGWYDFAPSSGPRPQGGALDDSPTRRDPSADRPGPAPDERVTPPIPLLVAGGVSATVSLIMLAGTSSRIHLSGWAAGSLVTIFLVALYRLRDKKVSTDPFYSPRRWADRLAIAILAVGLAVATVHAFRYAQAVSA